MKIKTSELTGRALDWAVARAQGWRLKQFVVHDQLIGWDWRGAPAFEGDELGALMADSNYSPSTDWAQGGPLIEREAVDVECTDRTLTPRYWQAVIGGGSYEGGAYELGSTPLIAAMRAIVAAKLGEEVDVPAELGGE